MTRPEKVVSATKPSVVRLVIALHVIRIELVSAGRVATMMLVRTELVRTGLVSREVSIMLFFHHLGRAGLHHRMVRSMVKVVRMILIIAMEMWGFVTARGTPHNLHLILFSPLCRCRRTLHVVRLVLIGTLCTCNTSRDWRSRYDALTPPRFM